MPVGTFVVPFVPRLTYAGDDMDCSLAHVDEGPTSQRRPLLPMFHREADHRPSASKRFRSSHPIRRNRLAIVAPSHHHLPVDG
jgi:hypothetical protein